MNNFDVAVETTSAASKRELDGEITSFGSAKTALRSYLQQQFKTRKLLREGRCSTTPLLSEFRSKAKPYPFRMQPHPVEGRKTTTDQQITYLIITALYLVIAEDQQRPLEPTANAADIKLIRQLPVILRGSSS